MVLEIMDREIVLHGEVQWELASWYAKVTDDSTVGDNLSKGEKKVWLISIT